MTQCWDYAAIRILSLSGVDIDFADNVERNIPPGMHILSRDLKTARTSSL